MKTIVGVQYKHPICTAYITVVGRSPISAEKHAKQLRKALLELLPEDACVHTPKDMGFDIRRGLNAFEVPVIVGACLKEAKAIIGRMVLRGGITETCSLT